MHPLTTEYDAEYSAQIADRDTERARHRHDAQLTLPDHRDEIAMLERALAASRAAYTDAGVRTMRARVAWLRIRQAI